jgi:hypothetical protein
MMPHCERPASETHDRLCGLHAAIWDADADGCEAHSAATELLPPMIKLAEVFGNVFLEEGLRELQVRALDYSERRYLDYEMLHIEDRMDLDDE